MLEFIKMFGLGILYTILFPFIVVAFALYLVYVFFNYLVMESINIFGFFMGYTFTTETKLEIELRKMKEESELENQVISNEGQIYNYEQTEDEYGMFHEEKGSGEQ